jgi:YHS domain-containing protein
MKVIVSLLIIVFAANESFTQTALRTKHFNVEKGVAIQGYDPVAYFTQTKALKGSAQYQFNHEGVIYRFANQTNLVLFKQNPQKYEPQYGGWCAYAMGTSGEKVEIDPETFKVANGRLYLFYHSWVNNTLIKWNENEGRLLPQADKNWKDTFK